MSFYLPGALYYVKLQPIIENIKYNGSAYTVIYKKSQ